MGKDVGYKCVRRLAVILVLAFFSVVASSPNLSTFQYCGCKGTTINSKFKIQNSKILQNYCFLYTFML